jgi:hypothetical protein
MSSKFIKNSRIKNKTIPVFNNAQEDMWYSLTSPDNSKEKEETRLWKEQQLAEKSRIENIPLGQLSFRDLYQFPFHQAKYGSWVYDAIGNFIFQFEFDNEETREKIIKILNGEIVEYNSQEVKIDGGYITININGDWLNLILIRGWGNLTGVGAYNLDGGYAGKIQDTLAEYIVEKFSKK